jgi:FKBP-type peptidyl-prolyl cis-trans isomerase
MNENYDEIFYDEDIRDVLKSIQKRMDELDETSEEYKKLSDIYVKVHNSYNDKTKADNEAKAKKREQKFEKKKFKKEKKLERELKEKELKNQRRVAWITGGLALLVGAFTAGASVYSTRQNRRNLEDTLYFEKTGIPRSSGHKYVSKKG